MIHRLVRLGLGPAALLIASGTAAAAEPGGLGGGDDVSIPVVRILAAFLFCAGLAYVLVLVLRRRLTGSGPSLLSQLPKRARRIEVLETRRLSPHADISLVREGGQEYLLLLFAGGTQVLRSGASEGAGGEP